MRMVPIENGIIGRCGLVGGSVSLGVVFGVSDAQAKPSATLFSRCLPIHTENSQLLPHHYVCLHADMFPTMIMN